MMNKILTPLTPLVLLSVLLTALSFSLSVQAAEVSLANPNTNGDGSIDFFIPIKTSTSGTYGDSSTRCTDGVGTCSDSVTINKNNRNSAGWLNLELMFNVPKNAKVSNLEVSFFDLDLNDYKIGNSWFWETAEFYYGGFSSTNSLVKLNRIMDGSSSRYNNTNNKSYIYNVDIGSLGITGGSFSIGLQLTANLVKGWGGHHSSTTFKNTSESLSAKVSYKDAKVNQVPEPSTLILFALALVGFATGRLKIK